MPDVDPDETERLLRAHAMPTARRMAAWSATRYPLVPPLDLLDDRVSDALEGAWQATRDWQASDRTYLLGRYVSIACHERIIDGIRQRLGRIGTSRSAARRRTESLDVALDAQAAGLVDHHGEVLASLGIEDPGYQAVEDDADLAILTARIDDALAILGERDARLAEAARWVWLQGRSQVSLAQHLGLTEGAITRRLTRARAKLQPLLTNVA